MHAFADGETIFEEGGVAESVYVVLRGAVRIRKRGDLVATVVAELGEGEIFGEQALIEGRPHGASAVAVGPTEVAAYDTGSFMRALHSDASFALNVMRSLSERLRETTERLQQACTQHVLDQTEIVLTQKAVLESDSS